MMDSTEIKITRVINPSRFFFIFRNEKLREKVEQHEIQLNEALVGYSGNQNYSPKVGNVRQELHNLKLCITFSLLRFAHSSI